MTDEEVIAMLRLRIEEGKLKQSDLCYYLKQSRQMVSLLVLGKRKWMPSDYACARKLLQKFTVINYTINQGGNNGE